MITARVGETVTLALPENPATGYRWHLTSPLAVVSDEFLPSGTAPGRAGERVFVLRVSSAGRHEVLAMLSRPWESTVRDVRTFVVDAS